MSPSYPRPELLASTAWLADNLGRSGVRAVDCRWRPDGSAPTLFGADHIEGAVRLDWSTDLVEPTEGAPFHLGGPDTVAAAASAAGIGDGTVAVLYDDSATLYATRVWWCLRAYGFTSSRILDGGYRAWRDQGLATASGAPAAGTATFTPRADLRAVIGAAEVRSAIGDPGVAILDARAPAEFRGQEGNALRLGHIPGAHNVPTVLLTNPGTGEFRPADVLAGLVRPAGLNSRRRIVVYAGSGVGAAKLAFGLALLGYEDVAVYDAGWAEWGDRPDLPVER